MKILQIVANYPPHIGGMENCVKEISERLAKKGHQAEVFTSDMGYKKGKLKLSKNLKINYLRSWGFEHTPIIPLLFFKLLKTPKDSIMHVHIGQAFIPEIAYLISKIKKIPYIVHIHIDPKPSGRLGFLIPLYKKFFLKKILKFATKIIVPTKDYAEIIKKYSISKKNIKIIPYGVDLKKFKLKNKKNNLYNLHKPIRLLFVGRFVKQKNIPLLIKSFKKIIKKDYNVKLHIIGDGEEKNNILALIKKEKLENKVILHGALSGKKLYRIYQNSDIFVLTSKFESFGIVLIEAMTFGLPVIASHIKGVRNVIKNNKTGLLVKPNNIKNFAKAIEKIINNPRLRTKMIKNGLKDVKQYDWSKIIKQIEEVYLKIK